MGNGNIDLMYSPWLNFLILREDYIHVIAASVYMDLYKPPYMYLNEVLINVTIDCVVESMRHAHCCAWGLGQPCCWGRCWCRRRVDWRKSRRSRTWGCTDWPPNGRLTSSTHGPTYRWPDKSTILNPLTSCVCISEVTLMSFIMHLI